MKSRTRSQTILYLLSTTFLSAIAFVPPNAGVVSKRTSTAVMSLTTATAKSCSQTLRFNDAKTGIPVHIIGTMHYNPYSVAKVEDIIHYYGEGGELGSVILEQCEERWALTQSIQPPGSAVRALLDNEFQAAAELANLYSDQCRESDVRVILADENIRENNERVNAAFVSTVKDIANPVQGWKAIMSDLRRGYDENVVGVSLPTKDVEGQKAYLDRSDLLDMDMLRFAPISLLRYILAFVAKKPLQGSLLLAWLSALLGYGIIHGTGDLSLVDEAKATAAGLALNLVMGVPLLGRVLLVALLGDRNEILANNIRAECDRLRAEGKKDQVCVVVLGLAHCIGVKRILCEK